MCRLTVLKCLNQAEQSDFLPTSFYLERNVKDPTIIVDSYISPFSSFSFALYILKYSLSFLLYFIIDSYINFIMVKEHNLCYSKSFKCV